MDRLLDRLMLGFGGGFFVHDGHDVFLTRRRRFRERRIELSADYQTEADYEEEKQRYDHPGQAAVGQIVIDQAGEDHWQQGGGRDPPERDEGRAGPFAA